MSCIYFALQWKCQTNSCLAAIFHLLFWFLANYPIFQLFLHLGIAAVDFFKGRLLLCRPFNSYKCILLRVYYTHSQIQYCFSSTLTILASVIRYLEPNIVHFWPKSKLSVLYYSNSSSQTRS